MNKTVARMLGEAVDVQDPDEVAPSAGPEEPAKIEYSNPSVEQLVSLWQGGQHEAVALRVLDALDQYADFLELAFQIGHDDAIQLGQIMDAMTADEKSPHKYDTLPDQDVSSKFGKRPEAGDAHNAVGE
jgi:hypothetical protein